MSGFGGTGYGDLIRRVLDQNQGGFSMPDSNTDNPGAGPGEPAGGFPMYGQPGWGRYNNAAVDMSRGFMGPYNFNNNMFGYTPYGNPYTPPPPAGGFPNPGGTPPGGFPGPGDPGDPGQRFPRDFYDRRDFWQEPGMYGGRYGQPYSQPYRQPYAPTQPPIMGGYGGYGGYGGMGYTTNGTGKPYIPQSMQSMQMPFGGATTGQGSLPMHLQNPGSQRALW